ncbi:MAG: hypothetical protein AAF927_02360 [Bacteroidota bacterium]
MSSFWPDFTSSSSPEAQWKQIVKNGRHLKDISRGQQQLERAINHQSDLVAQNAHMQFEATLKTTEIVAKNLQAGFSHLGKNQEVMIESLNQLVGLTSAMVAETQKTQAYLEVAIQRLAIPDSQKEREYKLKEGFKHLHNSVSFPDRFHDAYRNFNEVIAIEPADYFALYRLGIIYFYSPHHVDLILAEKYFRQAGEYALAESSHDARRSQTALGDDISSGVIRTHAGEAFNMQARCQFLLGNVPEALRICTQTAQYFPHRIDIIFEKARMEAALKKEKNALETVKVLLNKNIEYAIPIMADPILRNCNSIVRYISKKRDDYRKPVKRLFDNARVKIIPKSKVFEEFSHVARLLDNNTLLDARLAHRITSEAMPRTIMMYPVYTNDRTKYDEAFRDRYEDFLKDIENRDIPTSLVLSEDSFRQHLGEGPIWYTKKTTETLFDFILKEREAEDKRSAIISNLKQARQKTFDEGIKNIPRAKVKECISSTKIALIVLGIAWLLTKAIKFLLFGWNLVDWLFYIAAGIIGVVFLFEIIQTLLENNKYALKEDYLLPRKEHMKK